MTDGPVGCEKKLMYEAVITYSRWWLTLDAPILGLICEEGLLTHESYGLIIRHYGLEWGMPSARSDKDKYKADLVIQTYNEKRAEFINSKNIVERSTLCERMAELLSAQCYGTRQVSAATKIFWFLSNDNWTMFDQWAAAGLGVSDSDVVKRMKCFYERLSAPEIGYAVEAARRVLHTSPDWSAINPWRILDAYLMRKGRYLKSRDPDPLYSEAANRHFAAMLPGKAGQHLRDVARRISEDSADSLTAYFAVR